MMFRLLPAAAMTATALAGMTAGAATVDVYGVVDTGLHYVKADSGDTSVTMDSGISKGSRVGLIGSEDLGGGYKIVFNLETGFSLDDGSFDNTKNRLFNRNAYLGVASPYGEVRFGRQGRSDRASTARSSSTAIRSSATSTRKPRRCRSSTIRSCAPTT